MDDKAHNTSGNPSSVALPQEDATGVKSLWLRRLPHAAPVSPAAPRTSPLNSRVQVEAAQVCVCQAIRERQQLREALAQLRALALAHGARLELTPEGQDFAHVIAKSATLERSCVQTDGAALGALSQDARALVAWIAHALELAATVERSSRALKRRDLRAAEHRAHDLARDLLALWESRS